jgi:glyoxylase-like metal-dependent hydrolase (beta-lactamase superfamily II)
MSIHPLDGLTVLERGWLSSNNILIHAPDGASAALVDSGHSVHAEQTLALVRHALAGARLEQIVNTHLHSDHCGGNATLQAAFGAPIWLPPGQADAVASWDEERLSYRSTGQRCDRYGVQQRLTPGGAIELGARRWEVIAAPGHDPDAVMLFDASQGVLLSGDALWENGFGVVFPALEGDTRGFDDVAAVLDLIEGLPVRQVVPGHGAPFSDVSGALARARRRLAGFRADPARHARHGAKVLIKYHLMEVRQLALTELLDWLASTPMLASCHSQSGSSEPPSVWLRGVLDELLAWQLLRLDGAQVYDV